VVKIPVEIFWILMPCSVMVRYGHAVGIDGGNKVL